MIEKKLSNATPLDDENVVLRRSDKKELANVSLSNLNEVGEKHFLNKTQITNCILEAPNGVMSYTGSTIIIQNGLCVLASDGRNSDKTLKNKKIILSGNKTVQLQGLSFVSNHAYTVFLNTDANAAFYYKYVEGAKEPPISNYSTLWKNTTDNTFHVATAGEPFVVASGVILGKVSVNSSTGNSITSLSEYPPVELAKQQDIDGMWTNAEKALLYNVSITNTTGVGIDVSDYLPNDGNIYEVLCRANLTLPANSTAGYRDLIVYSDLDFGSLVLGYTATATTPNYNALVQSNNFTLPVGTARKISYYRTAGYSAEMLVVLVVVGYRKVR